MRLLFVDNFRGFDRQFIPLEDVNFFLGENSTGKSSVLALINLFSSIGFWLQQEFNADELQLGNFRDIVSISGTNFDSFRVGLIECPDNGDKKPSMFVFLMEFHDRDGVPSISKYCYLTSSKTVQIFFTNKRIKYKVDSADNSQKSASTIKGIFDTWLLAKDNQVDLKPLKAPLGRNFGSPLPILANIIEEEAKIKKKDEGIVFSMHRPDFADHFAWIAPLRSKPRRTYDQFKFVFSPEGDHAPYLIKKYLENKKSTIAKRFRNFMQAYGKDSGLLHDFEIKKFGKHAASPFELRVVLEDKPLNISNVGYGVSQSLPILVELFARSKNAWFAIQQPEVHLHPRAQAALGDIICDLALREKKSFLIETHSDFIIDRFRLRVNQSRETLNAQVVFFERTNGLNKAYPIKILSDGKYSDDQPESFRKFFIKEELSILGIR